MRKGLLMHRQKRTWHAAAAALLAAACVAAWAQPQSQPAPAGLEFRVAPARADIPQVAKTLTDLLAARGPVWTTGRGRYDWIPLRDGNNPPEPLVTAPYEGKTYLLVSTEPNDVFIVGAGGGITKAAASHDASNRPAISFELDDAGAARFAQLTSEHLNKALAIIVRGEAVSAPIIRAKMSARGIIVGQFSQAYAQDVAGALLAGGASSASNPPAASGRPHASPGPTISSAPEPSAQPVSLPAFELPAVRKLLEKRVGGVWKEDIHGSFPPSMHVLRGRIEAPPGRVLASYIVFPFGPEDRMRQETLARGYQNKSDARFIGASSQCTVLEMAADREAAANTSRDISEALGLSDFTPTLPEAALPEPSGPPRPSELLIRPKPHIDDEPTTHPDGPRVAIYLVKEEVNLAIDLAVSDLTLREPPLMTEADIAAYDANQNSLVLSPGGIKRLPEPGAVNRSGQGFVVVVDGQRWYLGVLWSPVSTLIPPELPLSHAGPRAGLIELPIPRPTLNLDKKMRKKLLDVFPPAAKPAK